ncbi:MAG: hypothetical protein RLZZ373_2461, partial [Pseudomonadota bacterium]
MLASLLKWTVLGCVLGIAGWWGWCAWRGLGASLALGPVLVLLSLNALALGLEQVLAAGVHSGDPAPRPSGGQRLRA